jgi:Kyakuja-Dileera-Zisupton transposase
MHAWGGADNRLHRACPPCFYAQENEFILPYTFLCAADRNMSLRRFKKVGLSDQAKFDSSYFVPPEYVQEFAHIAQTRSKTANNKKKLISEDDDDQKDAELEMEITGEQHTNAINDEGSNLPQEADPLEATFSGLVSDCAEKWKANADDNKKLCGTASTSVACSCSSVDTDMYSSLAISYRVVNSVYRIWSNILITHCYLGRNILSRCFLN